MDSFLQRFAGRIKGVLTGFDRIVFKGGIRPLMLAEGAMAFLRARGVLDKWMLAQSAALCAAAERAAQRRCGRGVEPASPIGPATTPRRGIRSGLGSTAGASIYTSTTTIRGTASPASGGRRGFPTASRSRSTAASGCAARSTGSASPTWFMATSSCTLPITSGRNGCRRGRTRRAGRRCWRVPAGGLSDDGADPRPAMGLLPDARAERMGDRRYLRLPRHGRAAD